MEWLYFIIGVGLFINIFGLTCESKNYTCNRCGHCFDDPRDGGYDYSEYFCPKCGSSDLKWHPEDRL